MLTQKNSPRNVLFRTPVFEIDEENGFNSSRFERSFTDALKRMKRRNGFYIKIRRDFVYTSLHRLIKPAETEKTIIFGQEMSIADAAEKFAKNISFMQKISRLEEDGYKKIVYNQRLQRIHGISDNTVVLDDYKLSIFCRNDSFGTGKELVCSDYTAQIIEAGKSEKTFATVAEAVKSLQYRTNAVGLRLIRRNYYTNGNVIFFPEAAIYYENLVCSKENLPVESARLLKKSKAKYFVFSGNRFLEVVPYFKLMRSIAPENWIREIG